VGRKKRSLYLKTLSLAIPLISSTYFLHPWRGRSESWTGEYMTCRTCIYARSWVQWLQVAHTMPAYTMVCSESRMPHSSAQSLVVQTPQILAPKVQVSIDKITWSTPPPLPAATTMDQDQSAALELHQKGQRQSLIYIYIYIFPLVALLLTTTKQLAPNSPSTL
jgi:hypothetical protein